MNYNRYWTTQSIKEWISYARLYFFKSFIKNRYPEFPDILFEDVSGNEKNIDVFFYRGLNIYFNSQTGFYIYFADSDSRSFFIPLKDLELDDSQIVLIYGKKILTQIERL